MVTMHPRLNLAASNHGEYHMYYLAKHSQMWCRRMHFVGTLVGVAGLLLGLLRLSAMTALTGAAAGMAICWAGDVVIQGTTPTTFRHPYWSMLSNFKMVKSMLTGDQPM